jgi:thiol-disulfide isomerase/thioredoxin|tara:strand:- start:295 stop:1809 length:1515 start_codon:yes stop_codon:yes gene_type:complete
MVAPEAKRSLSELLLNSDYLSVMTVDMTEVLPDGLVAIVKSDCPTCELIVPVLVQLENAADLTVVTQDCDTFPEEISDRHFDEDLAMSWHHEIETVPTLISVSGGKETDRTVGWSRSNWEKLSGVSGLGINLPEQRPGCGSLSVDPSQSEVLAVRFGDSSFASRRIEFAALEDSHEALFDRGWTDGLPVVPPTEDRVLKMLAGTSRSHDEVVAVVPPDLAPCTVEKIAINAVMAGCRPEYLPIVIAAVEAVCTEQFNMHGLLATTMPHAPVLIINGPIANQIGMNSGNNALGQGNRANSTIGRAIQLIIRNVGGGRPGEVDRSTFGSPAKVGFCFAEREHDSPWPPMSTTYGFESGTNTLLAFAGEAPRNLIDQLSRDPESLARTFAANLISIQHPKLVLGFDAVLAIAPDHSRVFAGAGWSRERLVERVLDLTTRSGIDLVRGAGGISEGVPESMKDAELPKFRPNGLHIVHCGGAAGLFSAIIGGWVNGETGSDPVCVPITP